MDNPETLAIPDIEGGVTKQKHNTETINSTDIQCSYNVSDEAQPFAIYCYLI